MTRLRGQRRTSGAGNCQTQEIKEAGKRQHLIIFQHIPKTAGVSVRSTISCNFDVSEILHVPDRSWKDREFAIRAAQQYRFIHGHLHFEFVRDLTKSAHIVTFLREPIERVLSLYFFLRNQPESNSEPSVRFTIEQAKSLSLDAFVAHTDPIIAPMVSNFQIQMLLSDSQTDQSSSTWLNAAILNLENYQFVGIADPDLMPNSMIMMSRIFGWIESGDSPRTNHTARAGTEVEFARARDIIAERNTLDAELYKKVREDFLAKLARRPTKTSRYRTALRAQRERYATGLTSPVTIDKPLRCWGWHDRETVSNQEYWRCAAQLRAGLELKVPTDQVLILLFELHSAHPRISVHDTAIETQTRVLNSRIYLANNKWVIATVVQREDIGHDGILSLQMVCKENENLGSIALRTPDSRYVTLGLETIEILTKGSVGLRAMEYLKQSICESHMRPEQLQELTHELEFERSSRRKEQSEAGTHQAALLDRATRSEEYAKSLDEERKKVQDENRTLLSDRARAQVLAVTYQNALIERAQRAETYNDSLSSELKKHQEAYQVLLADREQGQAEADRYQAALLERAQRAETYCESLTSELKKQQEERQALVVARERAQAEADRHHAALLERAQRAETYCESLSSELKKHQEEGQALVIARERTQAEADRHYAALLERAQRAETYCESLSSELKKHQEERQALVIARERAQAEAGKYQALVERATKGEDAIHEASKA